MKIRIDRMAHGPDGIGRLPDGRVVFVAGGVPGDRVEISLTKQLSRHAVATIVRIEEASEDRRDPRCSHALSGECGGCPWQHMTEEAQRREKALLVVQEIHRVASEATVRPILMPGPAFGYRRRARLGHKGALLGYRRRGARRIFDLVECPVLEPALAAELDSVREAVAEWPSGNVDILLNAEGDVLVGGPAGVFSQASAGAEQALVQLVLEAIPAAAKDVVELFCGAGTFTVPLAERGHDVRAWEMDRHALAALAKRAPTIATHRQDLTRPQIPFGRADAVLLDPPRKGASACIPSIIETRAAFVCYVSCDLMTLCRDLALLRAGGYRVRWIQPVDAFPQTHHIECVALLARENS